MRPAYLKFSIAASSDTMRSCLCIFVSLLHCTASAVPSIHYMAAALAVHAVAEVWSAAGVTVSDGAAVSTVAVPLCLTATVKSAAAGALASDFCNQRHPQA